MTSKEKNQWNWRKCDTGWPYKKDAPEDIKWLKDRSKLFSEGGNGWWMLKGTPEYNKHLKRIERELNDTNK